MRNQFDLHNRKGGRQQQQLVCSLGRLRTLLVRANQRTGLRAHLAPGALMKVRASWGCAKRGGGRPQRPLSNGFLAQFWLLVRFYGVHFLALAMRYHRRVFCLPHFTLAAVTPQRRAVTYCLARILQFWFVPLPLQD